MKKPTQKPLKTVSPDNRAKFADAEYKRLIKLFTAAGVDDTKLQIYDRLIRKVAEVYGILEAMKDFPTIRTVGGTTVETGAGKARVKYMAQYTNSMTKLNRDLMGVLNSGDDEGLNDYE